MSGFAILVLSLIGLALLGTGGVLMLPVLLVIAMAIAGFWLVFAILGALLPGIVALVAGAFGLVAWLVLGAFAIVAMVLLPMMLPLLLVVGLVVLLARALRGSTPQQASR